MNIFIFGNNIESLTSEELSETIAPFTPTRLIGMADDCFGRFCEDVGKNKEIPSTLIDGEPKETNKDLEDYFSSRSIDLAIVFYCVDHENFDQIINLAKKNKTLTLIYYI